MNPLKLAAIGAAGVVGYRMWRNAKNDGHDGPAAFADDHDTNGNFTPVRDAGPEAMRDEPLRPWTAEDQAIDESFPASDPPGNY